MNKRTQKKLDAAFEKARHSVLLPGHGDGGVEFWSECKRLFEMGAEAAFEMTKAKE